jgi:hypothetical protein
MQAQDEHPAGTDGAAPEVIRTEREFMEALRALRARSGLSYRDLALRMSRTAPRHTMAKSTLAALFAADALPRRPGQLTAIVDVLTAELTGSADVSARYLEAWTRLMTARSAQPGTPAGLPRQKPPPVVPAAAAGGPPAAPAPRQPAPLYWQPAYRGSGRPCTTPDEAKSDFEKAGGFWPLFIGCNVLSVITWLMAGAAVGFTGASFLMCWLGWCGPLLLITPIAALFRQPRGRSGAEPPAEYLRYEQRTTPRWPSRLY